MASIRLVVQGTATTIALATLFTPVPGTDDDAIALARAVQVALNTDRRALDDDALPLPSSDDRRGWWGDLDAKEIWGGWPIGTRLWLMVRDKITDSAARQGSTIEKARRFLIEALQPFVDARMASSFTIDLARTGLHQITGQIMIYRGPKAAIALEYQELWTAIGT